MLLSKQINDFFQINVYYIVDVHINSQRGEPLLCREYYLVLATEPQKTADILSYPQRQRTSNSFLYFTKAKTRLVESVSRACQLFHSIFKFTTQSVN